MYSLFSFYFPLFSKINYAAIYKTCTLLVLENIVERSGTSMLGSSRKPCALPVQRLISVLCNTWD